MRIPSWLALFLCAGSLVVLPFTPAFAGCQWVQIERMVDGAIQIRVERRCDDDSGAPESGAPESGGVETGADETGADETGGVETGAVETGADETSADETSADETSQPSVTNPPPTDLGLDAVCVRRALSLGLDPITFCSEPVAVGVTPATTPMAAAEAAAVAVAPVVTPGTVAIAFRNLPLPASELIVQPPDGRTLVNFDTNFYTESGPFERSLQLLGQQVDLRIWPSAFGWQFGDGTSMGTTSAGSPYPNLEVTHDYQQRGAMRPSVDTTYSAEFRVNGGAWRDVNGTVTIPGVPVALEVLTASPVLVGYR